MGVYIKGMEMPKNCDECPLLTEDEDYDVCFVRKRRVMWEWEHDRGLKVIHPKPDWCPLIEVPPHSDLIDINALKLAIVNVDYVNKHDYLKGVLNAINNAPTVIESDKDINVLGKEEDE